MFSPLTGRSCYSDGAWRSRDANGSGRASRTRRPKLATVALLAFRTCRSLWSRSTGRTRRSGNTLWARFTFRSRRSCRGDRTAAGDDNLTALILSFDCADTVGRQVLKAEVEPALGVASGFVLVIKGEHRIRLDPPAHTQVPSNDARFVDPDLCHCRSCTCGKTHQS